METLFTDLQGNVIAISVNTQLVYDDSGQYVSYCPALELSSYGDTETEAAQSFQEALALFTQDVVQRGTLQQLLLALGWQQYVTDATLTYQWVA